MIHSPEIEAMAQAYGVDPGDIQSAEAPLPPSAPPKLVKPWHPRLNPTQVKIFNDSATRILAYGERGSGKTSACAHKLVRHAYENQSALVLIIATNMRSITEGIWHDLETFILPAWQEGNRDKQGSLLDEGIDLEYTESKMDPNTKDRHRLIRNRFGGWSKLLLVSIQHTSQVQSRLRGPAPSMIYIEELTNCESRDYFSYSVMALGRRRDMGDAPQQFLASCNPEGPSHWVYKVFFDDCIDKKTGKRLPNYSVYHVPFLENEANLPAGYMANVMDGVRGDATLEDRMVRGKWIDRPTGEGMFKLYFHGGVHVKPPPGSDPTGRVGLMPMPGFPIMLGYDLGLVYSSVTMLQLVPTKTKNLWLVIDEVDHLDERILYKTLAWEIVDRMKFWRNCPLVANGGKPYPFEFMHVSDSSAINQWRPGGEGSYDAWEFEKEFNQVLSSVTSNVDEKGGLKKMSILGCPKGPGSVAARVRLVSSKLFQQELFISALCPNTRKMLAELEPDPVNPENPKRSRWIHKFDSLTYPIFKLEMVGIKNLPTEQRPPTLLRCGASP